MRNWWQNFLWLTFDNLFIIPFSNDYISFHPPTNTLWSLLNKSAEKPKPCNNGGLQVFLRMLSCESLSKASSFSSVPSQNRPLLLSSDQRYSRVVYECYSPAGFGILSIKSWVCGWATTKIKSIFLSIETQFSVLTFCAFKTFESTWIDREFFLSLKFLNFWLGMKLPDFSENFHSEKEKNTWRSWWKNGWAPSIN